MSLQKVLTNLAILFGIGYSKEYVATFSKYGVVGKAIVNNQKLTISLDISKANSTTIAPACYANGLSYHMHFWDQNKLGFGVSEAFGATCGFNNTQNHVDPFHACGAASNSQFCAADKTNANPSNPKCIPKTLYGSKCPASPKPGSYGCEVGDWSNKYGSLMFNSTTKMGTIEGTSTWEIDNAFFLRDNAPSYSIVFHCTNGGARVFCAKFSANSATADNKLPMQTSTMESVTADFSGVLSSTSLVRFNKTGEVTVMLDSTGKDLTAHKVADCASTGYSIAIYDGKLSGATSALGAGCKGIGKQWDPTNTCFDGYSSSTYCSKSQLCGTNTTYTADCKAKQDMWTCSPSDISGRGNMMFKPGTAIANKDFYKMATKTAGLPMLKNLVGKSIGIYCPDMMGTRGMDKSILACANIMETSSSVATTMGPAGTTTTKKPADNSGVHYFALFAILNAFVIVLFC